jgi:tetratricopeptide (TPR) repeat protein
MAANKKQADLFEIHDELRKAEYAINVRKNDLAIEIMMQVLAAHPENSVAFYTIGRAYMQKKLYPQALDAFKEALRLNPADDQAHALCGLALNSLRQYAQAESEAFRAIEIAPSSHFAHSVYASILCDQRKNLALAQEHCCKALELCSESARYHGLLGKIFAAQSLFEQAEAEYRRALSIDPEFAYVHNSYGYLLMKQKHDPRAAFEHFRIALMQNPNDESIKKNFFIALKAKHPLYWLFWRYTQLLRRAGRPGFFFVCAVVVLQLALAITGTTLLYAYTAPVFLLIVLLVLPVALYARIVDPLFNFLLKRGWIK